MDETIWIFQLKEPWSSFTKGYIVLKRLQFNQKEQQAFLEDLFVLVDDGIPPNRAIDMMVQVSRGISKEVAVSIANKISEGQPLAEGMRDWFSVNIVEIIRVGEEGGALAQTMSSGINSLSQSSGIISALVAAITYPVMVIVMACGVIVYLDRTVFTQFKLIKPIEQWPEAGQTLVAVAGIIRNWWWAVIVIGVAFVLIMRRILTSYVGDFRPFLDQFPPFSLYRRLEAARVMETLGLLVENGIVFKSALRVMQYRATPYVATHLLLMEHLLGVGKGEYCGCVIHRVD